MLDQNIALILSALVGGTLTVVGGFIANYYIQSSSEKVSKRKEIRNMLEQVYEYTQAITPAYLRLITSTKSEDIEKEVQQIFTYLDKIGLLVDFYLPPLKQDFSEYYTPIHSFIIFKWPNTYFPDTNYRTAQKEYKDIDLETITKKFRSSVTELFKNKGYSYF